jgi:hypothetical protein
MADAAKVLKVDLARMLNLIRTNLVGEEQVKGASNDAARPVPA